LRFRQPFFDQLPYQAAVAVAFIRAGGGAEQGDGLAFGDHGGEFFDIALLGLHFFEIAVTIFVPVIGGPFLP